MPSVVVPRLPVSDVSRVHHARATRRVARWRRERMKYVSSQAVGLHPTVDAQMLWGTVCKDVALAMADLVLLLGPDGAALALLAVPRERLADGPGPLEVAGVARRHAGALPARALSDEDVRTALEPFLVGLPPLTLSVATSMAPGFRGSLQQLFEVAAATAR